MYDTSLQVLIARIANTMHPWDFRMIAYSQSKNEPGVLQNQVGIMVPTLMIYWVSKLASKPRGPLFGPITSVTSSRCLKELPYMSKNFLKDCNTLPERMPLTGGCQDGFQQHQTHYNAPVKDQDRPQCG